MILSQKCQYALRAVFELSRREGQGPVKIASIADAQAIPRRFLENILAQLKQVGVVESRRGREGGYALARPSQELTVGDVIRVIEGPITTVECLGITPEGKCPFEGNCVFLPMWDKATKAMNDVYDGTTFQALVEKDRERAIEQAPTYVI